MKLIDWDAYRAAIFREWGEYFHPIKDIQDYPLDALVGIEQQKQKILNNTQCFLENKEAAHTLLWGARGTGKSSLVYALISHFKALRIVELPPNSLKILPTLIDTLRDIPHPFIIFCDDLSFDSPNHAYKILKSTLEGSLEKFPSNVLIYATSNHRHLIKESNQHNQDLHHDPIHAQDFIDEMMSLSDRFALQIGFYPLSVQEYKCHLQFYFQTDSISEDIFLKALAFASAKGDKSGRVAKQFYMAYQNKTL